MKKELISIFSHEMRTPLSIIKGYNELLYDGILGKLSHKQAEALDKSLININKLERIVDSIQYMGIDHSDAHIYDFLPLNFSDLVETTLVHSSREIKEKNLKLNTEFPDDMPVIRGDSKKLFHALSYLLDNAIKFSPQGSTISISAQQKEGRLFLSIRDNGVGIPEENISKIFDDFYQGDSSLTRKYSGMGLGLNICQRIINCHKGNIRVESRLNEGSTFHIDLPLMLPEDNAFYQAE
jgi:signal transduction histidine kinase